MTKKSNHNTANTNCDYIIKTIYSFYKQTQEQSFTVNRKLKRDINIFNFQQLFELYTGIDYKRFIYYLAIDNMKNHLLESKSIINISTLAELTKHTKYNNPQIQIEHISTNNNNNNTTIDVTIHWATVKTLFGDILIAASKHRLCAVFFVGRYSLAEVLAYLQKCWPKAHVIHDKSVILPFASILKDYFKGEANQPIPVILRCTDFQLSIWKALSQIPQGLVLSYGDLANLVGNPKASRAVGTAVGLNPIAHLIPCHRIINASGLIGQYHWGSEYKRALLALERARCDYN